MVLSIDVSYFVACSRIFRGQSPPAATSRLFGSRINAEDDIMPKVTSESASGRGLINLMLFSKISFSLLLIGRLSSGYRDGRQPLRRNNPHGTEELGYRSRDDKQDRRTISGPGTGPTVLRAVHGDGPTSWVSVPQDQEVFSMEPDLYIVGTRVLSSPTFPSSLAINFVITLTGTFSYT
ncbi:uncharacterized protein CTRU02_206443 [Colletotrichum truncatum]|uniref:Uncharacterized protein n=1 Tax=Colletotrichum truncatum TaxID=5467 RepID=A0ACC3Z6W4_COLTU|nr:uncharacterized protein CTRU02_15234 [Colletotrichum truncatum]KAF6781281.1 hypothetical protein CTRU02_15234 [Colletotrichum truncatum]